MMRNFVFLLLFWIILSSAAQAAPILAVEPDTRPLAVPQSAKPRAEPRAVPAPDSELNTEPLVVQSSKDLLSNGIYLILRQSSDKNSLGESSKNEHLVLYDERALEGDDKADITYFMIQKEPFIPLTLGSDPTKGVDTKGRTMLQLQLAEKEVKNLEDFTRENVNKGVAIVIGGTVVSSHKIRVPIEGGKLQITRCTDNRCETIYTELVKDRK